MATESQIFQLHHLFPQEWQDYIVNFEFDKAAIPLKDYKLTLIVPVGLYLLITFVLSKIIPKKKPTSSSASSNGGVRTRPPLTFLDLVAAAHNLFLSVLSLIMFLGLLGGWADMVYTQGTMSAFCNSYGKYYGKGTTAFWLYIFMISKWVEFIDTFLMILQRKPLIFLHVWHHATVPVHMYIMLYTEWDSAIFGDLFNAFVHIIMYYYYTIRAVHRNVWWKELVTILQLVQFVLCFVLLYLVYSKAERCSWNDRTSTAMASVFTFYLSYLILFIQFYISTYRKPRGSRSQKDANSTVKKVE